MNRRDFLQRTLAASALALLQSAPSALAQPARKARPKRGLGISARRDTPWREKLQAINASWFYSWSLNSPDGIPPGIEWVPMIFKDLPAARIEGASEVIRENKSKFLLGFNEPDAESQGDMTVEEALALWPKLMELGLPLVSPGCVHPDNAWMTAFMDGVKKRGLRVDFVAVHSYGGPNAEALMKRLESVHRLYRRPLWITEFAVGDWQAKTRAQHRHTEEKVVEFMEDVLPRLDRAFYVQRYAWFPARQDSAPLGTSALFSDDDGKLTPLGKCYRDT